MNKYVLGGLIVAIVVVGIGIGLADWYAGSVVQRDEAVKEAAEIDQVLVTARQAEVDQLAQDFEDVLNGLLNDVQDKVKAYKRARTVLTEIVQPVNLARPENVTENADVMQRVIPDLRGKMDGIMLAFERADEQVNGVLAGAEGAAQDKLLAIWRQTRDQHVTDYVAFFEVEEQIIDAHSALMAFYQRALPYYSYDAQADQLVFNQDTLRLQEADLKLDIKELAMKQAQLFVKRAVDKQAPPKPVLVQ